MGRYLREARFHTGKIEHYHRHALLNGYKQARYHYDELCGLIDRASRSKNDKSDAPVIAALRQFADVMMSEMRKREERDSVENARS